MQTAASRVLGAAPGVAAGRCRVARPVACASAAEPSVTAPLRRYVISLGVAEAEALTVGSARRALKAASAAAPPPPCEQRLLAALGCASAQLLATPDALPWVGSPEPGDGVEACSRRLVE